MEGIVRQTWRANPKTDRQQKKMWLCLMS